MAIDLLEIRGRNRDLIGVIDTAKSVIWHSVYFGVGDFEIYIKATRKNLSLLVDGYYVTRSDDIEVGIIEKINVTNNPQDGLMIVASGQFVKSILNRRMIFNLVNGKQNKPTILRGNVETAVRGVVANNAITAAISARNFAILELGALSNLPAVIVDGNGNAAQKQVSHENLLEYTDDVLQEYGYASTILLEENTNKLQYVVYAGIDRSVDNAAGNAPVIFSREFDNLSESDYSLDTTTEKNVVLIGGEGEGLDRFYSLLAGSETGLDRRETWLDAQSINRTLKASELSSTFPTGVFTGLQFTVGGVVYANIVVNLEKEYTLSSLQEDFPAGVVSGTKFTVGGVVYANKQYGDDGKYLLTALGYKAKLDVDGDEGDYQLTENIYTNMLNAQGKQTLSTQKKTEEFNGIIDVTLSPWQLNRDFSLGDIVTVQDNAIDKFINVRITEITEVQDENGYNVEIAYS